VFSDAPWHEWLKCPVCQKYWGKKDQSFLASIRYQHCGVALVDFWPREQVLSDLLHEITTDSSCWLAVEGDEPRKLPISQILQGDIEQITGEVIGFCWGYPITLGDLEKKLGVMLNWKFRFEKENLVAYQDEIGVLSDYRKKGIAKAMFVRRLHDFLARGLRVGYVRTRQYPEPSETFLWYTQKLGYKIIATYPDDDGRVILSRPFEGLEELLS
jgi:GNAT superfamily N-acetyltransferase